MTFPMYQYFCVISVKHIRRVVEDNLGIIIPLANCFCVCGGDIMFSCCPSVCLSFWFFNILKRRWNFIKFGKHIDIHKMNIYNRKIRARANSFRVIALC